MYSRMLWIWLAGFGCLSFSVSCSVACQDELIVAVLRSRNVSCYEAEGLGLRVYAGTSTGMFERNPSATVPDVIDDLKRMGPLYSIEFPHAQKVDLHATQLALTPGLRILDLSDSDLTSGFNLLRTPVGIENLDLSGTLVRDFKFLESMPKLKSLSLSWTVFRDSDCQFLEKLTELESLDLSMTEVTDEALRTIHKLKSIRELSLSGARIKDRGLDNLLAMQNLNTLHLEWTGWNGMGARGAYMSKVSIETLKKRNIEVDAEPCSLKYRLEFEDGNQDEFRLDELAALPEPLSVVSIDCSGTSLNDDDLKILIRFSDVKNLSLDGTWITDKSGETLHKFRNLLELNLSRTRFSDQGLIDFCHSESGFPIYLRSLRMDETCVTGYGFANLESRSLKSVSMTRLQSNWTRTRLFPSMTVEGLRGITNLDGLEKLEFTWPDNLERNDAIDVLNNMSGLKELFAPDAKFTEEEKQRLRENNPQLIIRDGHTLG